MFVNAFGMFQTLRTLEGTHVHTEPLAPWTIVEIRWPVLADHLRRFPEHVQLKRGHEIPEDVVELLEDSEIAKVVYRTEWGEMTPELIRECTGGVVPST